MQAVIFCCIAVTQPDNRSRRGLHGSDDSALLNCHSDSERAQIKDLRVRELADGVIQAQRREIKEMEWLIEAIKANGVVTTQEQAEAGSVPVFSGE